MTSRSRIIGASAAALVGVLGLSGLYSVQHVHNDLTQEALRHTAVELGVADSFEALPHKKAELLELLAPVGIVNVTVSGHHATITGAPRPQADIDSLKQASRRWGVAKVSYTVDASLEPASGSAASSRDSSTTPTTTTIDASVATPDVTVTVSDSRMRLWGAVSSEGDHQTLRQAAVEAYGLGRVEDELVVESGFTGATGSVDTRIRALAAVIATSGRASDMNATLNRDALVVTATVGDVAAKTEMDEAIAKAKGAGFEATGAVSVAGLDPVTTPSAANSGGTADQQVAALQAELDALAAVQTESVFFAAGSSELTPEANAVLDGVADAMSRYPLPLVDLGGHTDSDGDDASNLALSQSRADAALAGLVARGVSLDRLAALGYGESQPKADNETPQGRAANRRVAFTVKKGS